MEKRKTLPHGTNRRLYMPVECAKAGCGELRLPYDSYCPSHRREYMVKWKHKRKGEGKNYRYDEREGGKMSDFWEAPSDVGGIGNTVEIETPSGEKVTLHASPVKDDYGRIGEEPVEVRPLADNPCPVCKTVHCREGYPMCVCVKCGEYGRIVWCGQCVPCTYTAYCNSPYIGKEVADYIFADYVAWKNRKNVEMSKINKMPWETQ